MFELFVGFALGCIVTFCLWAWAADVRDNAEALRRRMDRIENQFSDLRRGRDQVNLS